MLHGAEWAKAASGDEEKDEAAADAGADASGGAAAEQPADAGASMARTCLPWARGRRRRDRRGSLYDGSGQRTPWCVVLS